MTIWTSHGKNYPTLLCFIILYHSFLEMKYKSTFLTILEEETSVPEQFIEAESVIVDNEFCSTIREDSGFTVYCQTLGRYLFVDFAVHQSAIADKRQSSYDRLKIQSRPPTGAKIPSKIAPFPNLIRVARYGGSFSSIAPWSRRFTPLWAQRF